MIEVPGIPTFRKSQRVPRRAELELEEPEGRIKLFTERVGSMVVLEQHINSAD